MFEEAKEKLWTSSLGIQNTMHVQTETINKTQSII